jgi:hypothetical protein
MKACIYCKHCQYEEAVYWGTLTGGDDASWNCGKGHFTYETRLNEGKFYILAQECNDFDLTDEIKELINPPNTQ